MNNYKFLIRQQLAEVRKDRIATVKDNYYNSNKHKNKLRTQKEDEKYSRLERKFWS